MALFDGATSTTSSGSATAIGVATPSGPPDAQLFETAAALLSDAVRGPRLGTEPALSTVLRWSCAAFYIGDAREARVECLAEALADYLRTRHVLRGDQATSAGLDAWASTARVTFLRVALAACARYHVAAVEMPGRIDSREIPARVSNRECGADRVVGDVVEAWRVAAGRAA